MATYIVYDRDQADEKWRNLDPREVKGWFGVDERKGNVIYGLAERDIGFGTVMEEDGLDDEDADIRILDFLLSVFLPDVGVPNPGAIPTQIFVRLFESLSKERLHDALQGKDLGPTAEIRLHDLYGISEDYIVEFLLILRPLAKKLKQGGTRLIAVYGGDIQDEEILNRAEEHYRKFVRLPERLQ